MSPSVVTLYVALSCSKYSGMSPISVKGCKRLILGTHGPYCDTGHPFVKIISDNPWQSHMLPKILQWSCYCFYEYPGRDSNTKPCACEANALTYCIAATTLTIRPVWTACVRIVPFMSVNIIIIYFPAYLDTFAF